MVDLEIKLLALEIQWREADDLVKAARAELAANEGDPIAVVAAIRKRIERAERMKQLILRKIAALEEDIDSASSG
jgi:hypothetical protein